MLTRKDSFFLIPLIAVVLAFSSGCQKNSGDNPTEPKQYAPEDDVADMIAAAFGDIDHTDGITAQLAEIASVAAGDSLAKLSVDRPVPLVPLDTTISITREKTTGSYTYTFEFTYKYRFSAERDTLYFDYNAAGEYNAPRMFGGDTAAASFEAYHLNSTTYYIDGWYSMFGIQTSKLRNHNQIESYFDVDFTELHISKSTKRISSGTAEIDVTITLDEDTDVDYSATMTFGSNNTATLIINSRRYNVDLSKGEANLVTS